MARPRKVRDRLGWTCFHVPLKGGDVRAGAERPPGARDNHGAHGRVQLNVVQDGDHAAASQQLKGDCRDRIPDF